MIIDTYLSIDLAAQAIAQIEPTEELINEAMYLMIHYTAENAQSTINEVIILDNPAYDN